MGDARLIQETLRTAARRQRIQRSLGGLSTGLLAGAALGLLLVLLHKIVPIPDPLAYWAWLAPLLGAATGLLAAGWRPVPAVLAARTLEARQALEQRLTTALEVVSKAPDAPWTSLVVADAARVVRGLDLRRLLPLTLPRLARWVPLVLGLWIAAGFLPEFRSSAFRKRQQDAEAIRATGRTVAELVRRELERRAPAAEPVQDALSGVAEAGDRLSQARLTRAEAVRDLENAARRLQEESRSLNQQPALERLRQAARTPASGDANRPAGAEALRKQIEKAQQALGGGSPEQLEQLKQQLARAQTAAAGLQGSPANSAAQQALQQSLNQLAQSTRDLGLNLAGLDQALQSLQNLQIDRLLKDLQLASDDLGKLGDMAKKLAEMQSQMGQLGKDLAEQLDRGQAEAAADTLQKMVTQLQAAGLTPAQMKQLLDEVARAVQPASAYGQTANLLRQAASGMQSGDKSGAAKNLAAAAEELKKLAQQAQDLQQLADALEALEGAQLAIASGRAWQPGGT
jgi:hypothetical protein